MSIEKDPSDETKSGRSRGSRLRRWVLRIGENYTRGLLILGVSYLLWRGLRALSARFDQFGGQSMLLLVLVVLALPPVVGWLTRHLIYPWMRRIHLLRAVLRGEERFFAEFAPDSRRGFPVALLNWPSEKIRAPCVITATYPGPEPGREYAAVFVPGSPDIRRGAVRIVPVEDLEIIDWTMAECLRVNLTCGTHSPGYLRKAGRAGSTAAVGD